MIEKIILKKTDSLADDNMVINFKPNTNIIIGPKGGGKSTLFDLVAGLEESFISKNVTEALAAFNLEFIKAIKFNGEEVHCNSLRKVSSKDKIKSFEERNDVIYQDDPIKKNLNNRKEIEISKTSFAKEECGKSKEVDNLLNKIDSFYYGMRLLAERNNRNDINWTNSFNVKDAMDTENDLILKLNYSNSDLITNISKEVDLLKDTLKDYQELILKNNKLLEREWNSNLIEKSFILDFNKSLEKVNEAAKETIEIVNEELNRLNKIKIISNLFQKSYKKRVENINNKNFEINGIKSFTFKANEHFKMMAKDVQKQKRIFESLVQEEVTINFDDSAKDNKLLSYKMPKKLTLKDEHVYTLLKIVLPTPGSSVSDITKWLEAIINKGVKPFDKNKLLNKFSKIAQEEVLVLANGKIYKHMSLGQRSIYGIEYKFNKSKGKNLFLDQPEDNLDNHTIARDILKLINQREEQVFIVTHNANIGILSNPGATIVADLNNKKEQYSEGTIVKTESGNSDAAHYLEGGVVYLKKRYEAIEGEKYDVKNK